MMAGDLAPVIPSRTATLSALLSTSQRVCLLAAQRGGSLSRTRHGFAAPGEPGAYHQARTVFALERAGLLAYAEGGDTTQLTITDDGRAVAGGDA